MEAEHLRTLVAIAQPDPAPSTARVNRSLRDPAVLRQITALERELGVPLFVRGPRRTRLTKAGAAFVPVAREFLASMDRSRTQAHP